MFECEVCDLGEADPHQHGQGLLALQHALVRAQRGEPHLPLTCTGRVALPLRFRFSLGKRGFKSQATKPRHK